MNFIQAFLIRRSAGAGRLIGDGTLTLDGFNALTLDVPVEFLTLLTLD